MLIAPTGRILSMRHCGDGSISTSSIEYSLNRLLVVCGDATAAVLSCDSEGFLSTGVSPIFVPERASSSCRFIFSFPLPIIWLCVRGSGHLSTTRWFSKYELIVWEDAERREVSAGSQALFLLGVLLINVSHHMVFGSI